MGKKYYRCNQTTIVGEACSMETWHTDDGWFHTKRHSKVTHYATGMTWEGSSKDTYKESEAEAHNKAAIWLSNWKQKEAAKAAEIQRKLKAQEDARKKAEAEAKRIAAELKRQKEEKLKAQQDAHRKAEEARKAAEQLKRQKEEQKRQLIKSRDALTVQLNEQKRLFDENHTALMNMARQILAEEADIKEFKMERNDASTKIIITLGPTGGGKSTFCNRMKGDKSLFGNKGPCETSGDSKSCTQSNAKLVVEIDGHKITIVDTPGIGDSFGRDREHGNKLCAYLKGCGGINAFVLIRNGTNPRFDQSFQAMLKEYYGMFGSAFFERLIIVATRIDSKINKMQFKMNNQAQNLTKDICDLLKLENVSIPVIPIGFEDYDAALKELANLIPSEKHKCRQIYSPIDALKKDKAALQSKESALKAKIIGIESQIRNTNNSISVL